MRRTSTVIGLLSLVPIGSALIPSAHISFARGLQQQRHNNNDCCRTTSTLCTQLDMRTRRRRRRRVRRGRHNHGSDDRMDNIDGSVTDDERCAIFLEDCDHTGIAKSIDAEYAAEEEKLGLSFWEVLER